MAHDIDFTRLSLKDTLDLAIFVEEEARQRYLEFVDQMRRHHTGEAAEFFSTMAGSERSHAERLQRRRAKLFGDAEVTADRSLVADVEAPDYHEVRAFMTVHRALEVALESEERAYRFYDGALGQVADEDLRALFEDLRAQELRHQRLIEEFRSRLPDPDDSDPNDYVDEPRAL
jgi:rubrerythrin